MNYWLIKSEPEVFSIDDLQRAPQQSTPWEGVRNYQARNFMRDAMQPGDQALFYHSNCKPPGIAGIASVASGVYPDPSQFIASNHYYDSASRPENPRWLLVDFRYQRHLERFIALEELKQEPALAAMLILRKGSRLSITPVEPAHFDYIIHLARIPKTEKARVN